MHFPPDDSIIRCFVLISGKCWLVIDGISDPIALKEGECILLPRGRAFTLTRALHLVPVSIGEIVSVPLNGTIFNYQGGGDCLGIACFFKLTGSHSAILLEELPPVVHIQKESEKGTLRWLVERMMEELSNPQPGGILFGQQLACMLLIQALRLHSSEGLDGKVGWLFALANSEMNAAISAIHADPAYHWTLKELARRAKMSRSIFALKFKKTVGMSPIGYLTYWRMMLAGERLSNSEDSVSTIAHSVGYESQSAFRKSFRNTMGCAPREYTLSRT